MSNSQASTGKAAEIAEISGIGSLKPLPSCVHKGLIAISIFSFLSFVSSLSLLSFLCYRLYIWRRKTHRPHNQFVILIMNLLAADIQQSLAFLLNVQWVANNGIDVLSPTCTAQGWFVSTGDLASGVWCFAIAAHTMGTLLFNFRLKSLHFYATIICLWLFVYLCAIIPLTILHKDLYVRAGAWCWVNDAYPRIRLYVHYIWIFMAELGVALIYALIYVILLQRITQGFYRTEEKAKRARDVAKMMAMYPLVYVICTLPLASARTAAMAGDTVPLSWLLFAGAMITSNGWLDVALYAVTRRILIFSEEPPSEELGIDTFVPIFASGIGSRFGTTTQITAGEDDKERKGKQSGGGRHRRVLSRGGDPVVVRKASVASWGSSASDGSMKKSYGGAGGGGNAAITANSWHVPVYNGREGLGGQGYAQDPRTESRKKITVTVTSEDVQMEDLEELAQRRRAEGYVMETPLRREDHMALEFESTPNQF